MMFWLLAVVLLASVAGVGYRQGAIRAAISLIGILLGIVLAGPLGKLIKPLLAAFGAKNPTLAWVLAPLVIFLLISILAKVGAFMVHQKVDVYFRYHAGDLRQALWERLSHRLGLCVGLVNGAIYLILISFVLYAFGYWTVQLASDDKDPRLVRLVSRLAQDLQSTGFAKVARAADPMPQIWYDAADLAGLLYNNSLLEARLSRYPAFLGLGERPEFKDIGADGQFTEMRQRREPVMQLLDYPKAQAIIQNPALLKEIWATVVPDLPDLRTYLETGRSPKYDSETILGRWNFSVDFTLRLFRQARRNISSKEMQKWKSWMTAAFAKTSFVAMTDHQAILKEMPQVRLPTTGAATVSGPQNLKGQWKGAQGKYILSLSGGAKGEQLNATVEGDRLTITGEGLDLIFDREI